MHGPTHSPLSRFTVISRVCTVGTYLDNCFARKGRASARGAVGAGGASRTSCFIAVVSIVSVFNYRSSIFGSPNALSLTL